MIKLSKKSVYWAIVPIVQAVAFQIDLTKLTIVKGGLGNSLNKKCVRFLDAALLKM